MMDDNHTCSGKLTTVNLFQEKILCESNDFSSHKKHLLVYPLCKKLWTKVCVIFARLQIEIHNKFNSCYTLLLEEYYIQMAILFMVHTQILMNVNCTMEDVITIVQILMAVINVLVMVGILLKMTNSVALVG